MIQLSTWFRRKSLESGLDRELQYHFDRRVADLTAAGIPEPDARRRVTVELGLAQVRGEIRDVWLTRWFRDFLYDLRFSARSFVRSPGFTAATLLSLALGIGATTAIYSLVDQVILHALPIHDPARLVLVDWNGDQAGSGFGSWNLMSYPFCRDLQQQTRFFDSVLCRAEIDVNLAVGGDPKPVAAEIVSGSYFSVLGIGPALGRVIEELDGAAPGAGPVVVLSNDFWQAEFGGAADIVGRKLLITQHPMTVVGVATAAFHGVDIGAVPALWIPASMYAEAIPGAEDLLRRPTFWMQVLARLRPNLTPAQAQAGLQPWFKAWLQDNMLRPGFPIITTERRRDYLASTLQGHSPLRRSLSYPLWLLLVATGVLLGLASLNVAGLFLARGSARGVEIGTRLGLGASRGRIGRQLRADSVLLALAGGVLGVAVAPLAIRALIAFLPHDLAANNLHGTLSLRLLAFTFFASLTAGLLSGLAPALHAGGGSMVSSLRERAGTGFGGIRLRKCIVTLQVAFALILLIGAALFVRTLAGLLAKGPGFETSGILSFAIAPVKSGYSRADAARLVRRLDEEIRALPTTHNAAAARVAFLTGESWNNSITIQTDRRIVTDLVNLNAVSPVFFSTLGIRIVRQADPRLPILWFRTLDDQVNRSLTTERLLAALSGSFGALALLLSLIGLYGVMSFVVTRRTREIGIRLALGATGASAIGLVLRDAVTMVAAGMAIALPCVAALGKLLQSQLFGVTATDPATVAAAALVLGAGALAAAFIPAWRASNVSPTDALRLE